jgi:hypothetical protein
MSICTDCRFIIRVNITSKPYWCKWKRKTIKGTGCCKNYRPQYKAAESKEGNDGRPAG